MAEDPAFPSGSLRSHMNRGGYRGERIPVTSVLEELRREAERTGWRCQGLTDSGPHTVWHFARAARDKGGSPRRVYISAGIHGDEPAGPLAALRLLTQNDWPADVELDLFPCLNPIGLDRNLREGPEGADFNRDYRHPRTPVVQAHVNWLSAQPDFDVALLLHEDWESDGFYLYELAAQPHQSMAEAVVRAVTPVCPILQSNRADDWPAESGIVRPNADPAKRPDWPEALYLFQEKTDLCYTFEAPSDYDLTTRVTALVTAVKAVLLPGRNPSVEI